MKKKQRITGILFLIFLIANLALKARAELTSDQRNIIIIAILGTVGLFIMIAVILGIKETVAESKERKEAKFLGFRTLKEMKRLQAEGYNTKAEWEEAQSGGYLSKEEQEYGREQEVESRQALYVKINQNIADFEEKLEEYKEKINALLDEVLFVITTEELDLIKEKYESILKDFQTQRQLLGEYSKKPILNQELIHFPEDLSDKETNTASVIYKLRDTLKERTDYVVERNKVVDLLNQFTPNVPVQLERIAGITDMPQDEVESFLKDIVEVSSELGEYLELEQVFIRKTEAEFEIDKLFKQFQDWEKEGRGKKA